MASSVTATLHTMVLSLLFPSVVHMHMGIIIIWVTTPIDLIACIIIQ